MSLILDALKKLDREKKSSRRSGTADIAAEILKPDLPRSGKRIPLYFAAGSLAAVAAAAITYAVMGGLGPSRQSSPPGSLTPPAILKEAAPPPPRTESEIKTPSRPSHPPPAAVQQASPVAPHSASSEKAPSPPVTSPAAPPRPAPPPQVESRAGSSPSPSVARPAPIQEAVPPLREQARDRGEEIGRVSPKIPNPIESKQQPAAPVEEKASRQAVSKDAQAAPKIGQKPGEPAPKESGATAPALKLSGILWHETPSERRAVINSMVLPEGSVIEGAKVLEILPTRVRFTHNGRPFEISIFP